MTGCYQPNHTCIDNCIHTYAGVQLRLTCAEMMRKQGMTEHRREEATGRAKITPGIIKYPFWQMTAENENARYICLNKGEINVPPEIEKRSLCVDTDIYDIIVSWEKEIASIV